MSLNENGYSILVVDDEPLICELVQEFLRGERFAKKIVTANSVTVATQKIQNEEFDLVIIDYNLPGRKGIQFVEAIKKNPDYKDLPFILISGEINPINLGESMKLGVKHVLVKPFSRKLLLDTIEGAVKPPQGKKESA